eukprot:TRINITY_DN4607_c0_g1_i1.p1 TRINITY_DN4607_c0_g1~~TRINITY_DN4607_c0_g1_i1.p1  ORF type:complete len:1778 (+),score=811.49 TRINITY_DN4607_c0_g1_i1:67-5400(+)
MSAVQVIVRVRPFNEREQDDDEVVGDSKLSAKDMAAFSRQRTTNFEAPRQTKGENAFARSHTGTRGEMRVSAAVAGRKSYSGLPMVVEGRTSVRNIPGIPKITKSRVCVAMDAKNAVSVLDPWNGYTKEKTFQFDGALWSAKTDKAAFAPEVPFADQEYSYKVLCSSLVDNVITGYNNCLFAYGQTGSGKTYTMMGNTGEDDPERGVVPRLCEELFQRMQLLRDTRNNFSFSITASYLEVYMEKVYDLLLVPGAGGSPRAQAAQQDLRVRQHPTQGVYVEGITEVKIDTLDQILDCLRKGNMVRHTASTKMNDKSSRSHSIFTIHFNSLEMLHESDRSHYGGLTTNSRSSKLNLVDLAGSEVTSKSGVEGVNFTEATKINLSLTTLGRVIDALSEMSKKVGRAAITTPPYRDSMLTFLLSDSLGGNSKTTMVATISPHYSNWDETVNTLRYASRAREIVNVAVVNEDPSIRRIRELTEENERLKKRLIDVRDKNVAGSVDMQSEHINLKAAFECMQEEARLVIEALFDAPECNGLRSAGSSPSRPSVSSVRSSLSTDRSRNESRTLKDCLLPIRMLRIDRDNAVKEKDKAIKDAAKGPKSAASTVKVKKSSVAASKEAMSAMEDDVAEMKKKLKEVEKDLTQQRAKAKSYKSDLEAAEKKIRQLDKSNDKKQSELDDHRSVYVALEKKNNKLAKALETVTADNKQKSSALLASQANPLQTTIDEQESLITKLKKDVAASQQQSAEAALKYEETIRKIDMKFTAAKEDLQQKSKALKEAETKVKANERRMSTGADSAKEAAKDLRTVRIELETVKVNAKRELEALHVVKGDEIKVLKRQADQAQNEAKEAKKMLEALSKAKAELEAVNAAVKKDMNAMQQSMAADQVKHLQTVSELGELGSVMEIHESLQTTHKELTSEHETLQASYKAEVAKAKQLEDTVATQTASQTALQASHTALQEKQKETSAALEDVRAKLTELTGMLTQTTAALEAASTQKEQVSASLAASEAKAEALEKSQAEKLAAVDARVAALEGQKADLDAQLREHQVQAGVLQANKAELETAKDTLMKQLAESETAHRTYVAEAVAQESKVKEQHSLALSTKGQEIVTLKEAGMTKEGEITKLNDKIAMLEQRVVEKENTLEKLMDQKAEMLTNLSGRQDDILAEKTRVLELTAEVSKARDAVQDATQQKVDAERRIATLEEKLASMASAQEQAKSSSDAKLVAYEAEVRQERLRLLDDLDTAKRDHEAARTSLMAENKRMKRVLGNGVAALGVQSRRALYARAFYTWAAFLRARHAERHVGTLRQQGDLQKEHIAEIERAATAECVRLSSKARSARARSGELMKKYAWTGHLLEREQRYNRSLATQRLMLLDYAAGYADVHVKVAKLNTLLERSVEALQNDKRQLEEDKETLAKELEVKTKLVSVLRTESEEQAKVARAAEEKAKQTKKKSKKEAVKELDENQKLMLARWEHEYQNVIMRHLQEFNTSRLEVRLAYLQFEQREYDQVMLQQEDQMEEHYRKQDVLMGKVKNIMELSHVYRSLVETAKPVVGMEEAIHAVMELLATVNCTDLDTLDRQFMDSHRNVRRVPGGGGPTITRRGGGAASRRGTKRFKTQQSATSRRTATSWQKLSQVVLASETHVNQLASRGPPSGLGSNFKTSLATMDFRNSTSDFRTSAGAMSDGSVTPHTMSSCSPRPDMPYYKQQPGRPPLPAVKRLNIKAPLVSVTPERRMEGAISFEEDDRKDGEDPQPEASKQRGSPKSDPSDGEQKKDCSVM